MLAQRRRWALDGWVGYTARISDSRGRHVARVRSRLMDVECGCGVVLRDLFRMTADLGFFKGENSL